MLTYGGDGSYVGQPQELPSREYAANEAGLNALKATVADLQANSNVLSSMNGQSMQITGEFPCVNLFSLAISTPKYEALDQVAALFEANKGNAISVGEEYVFAATPGL